MTATSSRTIARLLITSCLLAVWVGAPLSAASLVIVNADAAGVGFNDPTAVSPVAGNSGTTLGEQRRLAFQAAADRWGSILQSPVPIEVEATIGDLECDATSAILGTAGPGGFVRDAPGLPQGSLWYPLALASSLTGTDQAAGAPDVVATFNRNLDDDPACLGGAGWWYGIDAPAPPGMVPFVETVTHEIAHGLGFTTVVDRTTGAKGMGFDDVYMRNLEDHSTGKSWPQMSDAERRDSSRDVDLHWTGGKVGGASGSLSDGAHFTGHIEMHAPSVLEPGSSVSHWAADVTPDEIMEAFLRPNAQDLITTQLLEDIGWQLLAPTGPCISDNDTLCLISDRFRIELQWRTGLNETGPGVPVAFTDNAGLLWFFDADNFEMLIKVLDGCEFNDHFWVFFAATTAEEFTVTVTDTQTGEVIAYNNPLGQRANAVTDTAAFATCPSTVKTPSERYTSRSYDSARESTARLATGQLRDITRQLATARTLQNGTVQIASAGLLGPTGTTYEAEPLLGTDVDGDGFTELFTLQPVAGTGNIVTFDGAQEELKTFDPDTGLTTVPRAQESIATLGPGKIEITLTMDTRDGDTLFPTGFTAGVGGPDLDAGVIAYGLFGGDPLDFTNQGVTAASFDLFAGNQLVDSFLIPESDLDDFFGSPDPWDGSFGVVFDGAVGQEVSRVESRLEVMVEDETVEPFDCVEDEITLCLGVDGRFQVRVDWTTLTGSGTGKRVKIPGSVSSGLFYFFDQKNLEMLIKVLDGCGFNLRKWVFFAATTREQFLVEVIDTETGLKKTYINPQGQPADAITDTSAFSTCP